MKCNEPGAYLLGIVIHFTSFYRNGLVLKESENQTLQRLQAYHSVLDNAPLDATEDVSKTLEFPTTIDEFQMTLAYTFEILLGLMMDHSFRDVRLTAAQAIRLTVQVCLKKRRGGEGEASPSLPLALGSHRPPPPGAGTKGIAS